MKNKKNTHVAVVESGSIGEELGITPGDQLISINGTPVEDIIDYLFLISDEYVEVEIQKPDGEIWTLEIDKDYDESLGIEFENPILDEAGSCCNQCVFCFIDQMPPGMRDSLYFKDDDSRLSFLQGNFITLTNVTEDELDRMIRYQISPVNISIHTTDPELRVRMLGNRFAGNLLPRIKKLADGGIQLNGQIVLCPGYNDEAAFDKTIEDLISCYPGLCSVAVVPVGLTRFRENLPEIMPVDQNRAQGLLKQVQQLQAICLERIGTRFIYASDEFYLLAGQPIPNFESYEDFPQLENGVGLLTKLEHEFKDALKVANHSELDRQVTIATGVAAAPFIRRLCDLAESAYAGLKVKVIPVENHFFGPLITVAGLLTGQDVVAAVNGDPFGQEVLITRSMLKSEETLFLDDLTIEDVSIQIGKPVVPVESDGEAFLEALLGKGGKNHGKTHRRRRRTAECW